MNESGRPTERGPRPQADAVVLRALTPDDHRDVAALASRAFSRMQASFVVPSASGGVAALVEGRIAAASLLRVFRLPNGERIGMIAWLMTDPDRRGLGLASRLVEASVDNLREAGCRWIVTDVEGYNTASANVFHGSGFRRLDTASQARLWGLSGSFWVWLRTGVSVDPGHFLWVIEGKGAPAAQKNPAPSTIRARIAAILANWAMALVAFSLGGGLLLSGEPGIPGASQALAMLLGVAVLLLTREAAMRLAAGSGPRLTYRAWQGGWGISIGIALFFGRMLPLPGNLYPEGDGWRTRDHLTRLGRAAVANAVALGLMVLAASALRGGEPSALVDAAARAVVFVGKPLLLFDTVVAVAPFEGFNARHLRDYHKPTWLLLAAASVAVFVFG